MEKRALAEGTFGEKNYLIVIRVLKKKVNYKRDWVKYSAASDVIFFWRGGVLNNLPSKKVNIPGYRLGASGTSPRRRRGTDSVAEGAGGEAENSAGKGPPETGQTN